MKRKIFLLILVLALVGSNGLAQRSDFVRTPVKVPDILGFKTLKCDFHMHSVFSDGNVWPTVRVEEAWVEGLDAISITDHIEYQPHRDHVVTDHNSSYEIAAGAGKQSNILVIHGSEVTRSMPPGHLNAIFITNSNSLDGKDWREALEIAHRQGGFVFWNHPCWTGQQPDGVGRWYEEHSEIFDKGFLQGIEVVNSANYCPEAHRLAIEKGLTLMATSDIHPPIHRVYDIAGGDHRPITLVLARERTVEGIREALWAGRTVLLNGETVIGSEELLLPLFRECIELVIPEIKLGPEQEARVRVLDLRWLKPLNGAAIVAAAKNADAVLVVDEGRRTGGIAEELFTLLDEQGPRGQPKARVTGADSYIPLGPAADTVLVSEAGIAQALDALLQE